MKTNLLMRELIAICLVATILCSGCYAFLPASALENTDMDNVDVILSAHYFLSSNDDDENFWKENDSVSDVVPLYSVTDEIVAYYVKLEQGGYVVVNNNSRNPAAIEFGEGDNPFIRTILDCSQNPHIIYNHPLSVYDTNNMSPNERTLKKTEILTNHGLYDFYPDLLQDDIALSNIIAAQKTQLLRDAASIVPLGDGDYGFIPDIDMPAGEYDSDSIPCANVEWVVYNDFSNMAKDHCGAVAVTNMALYFAEQGYSNLYQGSEEETFDAVYEIMGDGPKLTVAFEANAKEYFSDCGYTLQSNGVAGFDGIITAVHNERPIAMLLANGIFKWHWVLGVGWRSYDTVGGDYIQIMNGWDRNTDVFYRRNSGSLVESTTQYWI